MILTLLLICYTKINVWFKFGQNMLRGLVARAHLATAYKHANITLLLDTFFG